MSLKCLAVAMASALWVVAGGAAWSASLTLKDLEGAWLADGIDCDAVFTRSNGRTTLRKPINEFVAGFAIDGKILRTPLASCRIQKFVPLENGARLIMSCSNSMSTGPAATTLRFGRAGMLERVDDGNPAVSYYNRCKL